MRAVPDRGWVRTTNEHPVRRAAAGLGAAVVRADQEALVAAAWEQADALRATMAALNTARLGVEVARSLTRRAGELPDPDLLQLTSRAHAFLRTGGTTVRGLLAASAGPGRPRLRGVPAADAAGDGARARLDGAERLRRPARRRPHADDDRGDEARGRQARARARLCDVRPSGRCPGPRPDAHRRRPSAGARGAPRRSRRRGRPPARRPLPRAPTHSGAGARPDRLAPAADAAGRRT